MRRQSFKMASHRATVGSSSLLLPRLCFCFYQQQRWSPSHRRRRLSSWSFVMAQNNKMWCVLVMWMVLSIAGDRSLMKMSAAAADTNSGGSGSSSSSSSGGGGNSESAGMPQCMLKGRVYTERLWYGYLFDKAFHRDYAKIQYTISYPVKECCTNLLIYYDDQIKQLKQDMSCEERERVLPSNNNQVIPLHTLNKTVGCRVWNDTDGESYYVCIGERIFRSSGPRTWYFALSRCQAKNSLTLNYAFNISGYYGDCEEDPLVRTYIPPSPKEDNNVYLSLALGVVAGLASIAAVVFFVLWFIARRNAANSKGSSVTSSQATMTQDDIFYVNPSLSDREQAEYGQSQASSENYYEVIPERRSYESINPHLLAAGGAGGVGGGGHHPLVHGPPHLTHHLHPLHAAAAHGHGTHPRHQLHHLHGPPGAQGPPQVKESAFHRPQPGGVGYPVFDDYPPPPYQPPRLLGGPRHHTLHHPTPHHHHHSLSLPPTARPRPPLLSPTHHGPSLSFPAASVLAPPGPAPPGPALSAPVSSSVSSVSATQGIAIGAVAAAASAAINNNTSSGNNNNGNSSNNNLITATSAITMNTTTNTVSLGETTA